MEKDPKNIESHHILPLPLKRYRSRALMDSLMERLSLEVIVDRMKLSANFSITFFSPPFFLPEIHRLSDQIEHILRVFILLTCNNSSFVSRTDDSIKRVKKKREKMEKSRRMRHASCAISSNLFPPRMPRITSRNAILCFVLPIVSFFFFFYRRQLARCTSANKLCKGNEMSVENTGTITRDLTSSGLLTRFQDPFNSR